MQQKFYILTNQHISLAPCAVISCWEACIIGFIGGFLPQIAMKTLDCLHIDDAVYATALHFVDGIWVSERIILYKTHIIVKSQIKNSVWKCFIEN